MVKSNLLILGAGQYGLFVKELAEATEKYERISFLDDKNPLAIGKMCELDRFTLEYRYAIAAVGDSEIRLSLTEKLLEAGYTVPTIISSAAFVSPSAEIGAGTVIEPMAVVQSGTMLGRCCLICSGAVVKHNATLEDGCYIDCNSVVAPNEIIPTKIKITVL